jgi:hypothetical protein
MSRTSLISIPIALSGDRKLVTATMPADEQELVHVLDIDQAGRPGEAPLQKQPEG